MCVLSLQLSYPASVSYVEVQLFKNGSLLFCPNIRPGKAQRSQKLLQAWLVPAPFTARIQVSQSCVPHTGDVITHLDFRSGCVDKLLAHLDAGLIMNKRLVLS